jgi:hypothetical protein
MYYPLELVQKGRTYLRNLDSYLFDARRGILPKKPTNLDHAWKEIRSSKRLGLKQARNGYSLLGLDKKHHEVHPQRLRNYSLMGYSSSRKRRK